MSGDETRVGEPDVCREPEELCAGPGDLGMATAEYAVATLAAVGFAGVLFAVLRSGEVQELLLDLVRRALSTV